MINLGGWNYPYLEQISVDSKIGGFTVGNVVLRRRVSVAVKRNLRP